LRAVPVTGSTIIVMPRSSTIAPLLGRRVVPLVGIELAQTAAAAAWRPELIELSPQPSTTPIEYRLGHVVGLLDELTDRLLDFEVHLLRLAIGSIYRT
jgi:hypothetical protein